jgi:hypothetical protein
LAGERYMKRRSVRRTEVSTLANRDSKLTSQVLQFAFVPPILKYNCCYTNSRLLREYWSSVSTQRGILKAYKFQPSGEPWRDSMGSKSSKQADDQPPSKKQILRERRKTYNGGVSVHNHNAPGVGGGPGGPWAGGGGGVFGEDFGGGGDESWGRKSGR